MIKSNGNENVDSDKNIRLVSLFTKHCSVFIYKFRCDSLTSLTLECSSLSNSLDRIQLFDGQHSFALVLAEARSVALSSYTKCSFRKSTKHCLVSAVINSKLSTNIYELIRKFIKSGAAICECRTWPRIRPA